MHYIYVNKNNSQTKVFAVPFDKELFESQMIKIERILLRLKKGKLPKKIRPDCVDPKCKFNAVCGSDKTVSNLMLPETKHQLKFWKPKILNSLRA